MKSLIKADFLKVLKEIVTQLEKNEVKYDIPYVHIDKVTYNYINILITDNITTFELNKMFNLSKIKEKDKNAEKFFWDLKKADVEFKKLSAI